LVVKDDAAKECDRLRDGKIANYRKLQTTVLGLSGSWSWSTLVSNLKSFQISTALLCCIASYS